MPQLKYVVKFNEATDLYLIVYSTVWDNCQWGSPNDAITWNTLAQAESVASLIGHGTVGTTKP